MKAENIVINYKAVFVCVCVFFTGYHVYTKSITYCVSYVDFVLIFFLAAKLESAEELEQSVNINEAFQTSVCVGQHAFSRMENDVDKYKKNRLSHQQKIYFMEKKKRSSIIS